MMRREHPKGCSHPLGEVRVLDVQHRPVSTPVVYEVSAFVRDTPANLCWNEAVQNQDRLL